MKFIAIINTDFKIIFNNDNNFNQRSIAFYLHYLK